MKKSINIVCVLTLIFSIVIVQSLRIVFPAFEDASFLTGGILSVLAIIVLIATNTWGIKSYWVAIYRYEDGTHTHALIISPNEKFPGRAAMNTGLHATKPKGMTTLIYSVDITKDDFDILKNGVFFTANNIFDYSIID